MDVEKIPPNILDAVRERLGNDENDTRFDSKISKMSPKELMAKWSGWHLGDESWALSIICSYEHLKELEKEEKDEKPEDKCLCGRLLCGLQEKKRGTCADCYARDCAELEFQLLMDEQEGKT